MKFSMYVNRVIQCICRQLVPTFSNLAFIFSLLATITDEDGLYGIVPQSVIDETAESLLTWHEQNFDLVSKLALYFISRHNRWRRVIQTCLLLHFLRFFMLFGLQNTHYGTLLQNYAHKKVPIFS